MNYSDYNYTLEEIKKGLNLKYVSDDLKNNSDIVYAAFEIYSGSLQYASEQLKNDYEFILKIVNLKGRCLKYASHKLKNNYNIVLEAVKNNGYSLKYSSKELQNNSILIYHSIKSSKENDSKKYYSKKRYIEYQPIIPNKYMKIYKNNDKVYEIVKTNTGNDIIKYKNDYDLFIIYE